MEDMFALRDVLICLDDILGYAIFYYDFLDTLDYALRICVAHGLKLIPSKCTLVLKEVLFCGSIVGTDGVRFNPHNYNAYDSMPKSTKVGDLMQLVRGANWMHTAIQRFCKLVKPLQDLQHSTLFEKHARNPGSSIALCQHGGKKSSLLLPASSRLLQS